MGRHECHDGSELTTIMHMSCRPQSSSQLDDEFEETYSNAEVAKQQLPKLKVRIWNPRYKLQVSIAEFLAAAPQ